MRRSLIALALAAAAPLPAQSLMADMHGDVREVQQKIVSLAKAMPESTYGWRPGAGVRSVSEVLMHVASENYYIPIAMGQPAPVETGMKDMDFKSIDAYTGRPRTKAQVVADVEASFAHLHQAMALTTDQNLGEHIKMFGADFTRQKAMVLTVTHLHEHLGQLIAYARSNGVVPPWSK